MLREEDWPDAALILLIMEDAWVDDRNIEGIARISGMDRDRCKALFFEMLSPGFLLNFKTHWCVGFVDPPEGLARTMDGLRPVVEAMTR